MILVGSHSFRAIFGEQSIEGVALIVSGPRGAFVSRIVIPKCARITLGNLLRTSTNP